MAKHPLPTIGPGRSEFRFTRTVCACAECVRSCRFIPGYLIPADLERIRQQLAPEENLLAWTHRHLLASPGAKVLSGDQVFRIRTLVPARRPDGACLFFSDEDRCMIHSGAPFGCAFFDSHMAGAEANRRSKRGLQAILDAWHSQDTYAQIWLALAKDGLVAPPPEVCRTQMRQAEKQLRP